MNKQLKINCLHCDKQIFPFFMERHSNSCSLNPLNKIDCLVCGNPIIKEPKKSKGTCSHACANKLFRTGENHGNWKKDRYRTTCFAYHEKKCVICQESNIVEVHHLDHDSSNNEPENLIPLCPTHHQYWHSKYKNLVEAKILAYINKWKKSRV